MDSQKAEQVGMIFKLIYKFFLKKILEKAVKNSKNTIDDKALEMFNKLVAGE